MGENDKLSIEEDLDKIYLKAMDDLKNGKITDEQFLTISKKINDYREKKKYEKNDSIYETKFCQYCGEKIAAKAEICLRCGHPIPVIKSPQTQEVNVQTIEFTSKKYKKQQLIALGLMVISSLFIISSTFYKENTISMICGGLGCLGCLGGLFWYAIILLLIWWYHK
jgi:hypothetical protein